MQYRFIILSAAVFMLSCNTSGDRKASTTAAPATTFAPTLPNSIDSIPATPSNAAVALNPEHGAPGHTCDVPVGTPLPGAKAAATPAAQAPAINAQQAPVVLPKTGGQVKLNPPHGAPGHSCAVLEGEPLPQ